MKNFVFLKVIEIEKKIDKILKFDKLEISECSKNVNLCFRRKFDISFSKIPE
jgi:hypothetical protein